MNSPSPQTTLGANCSDGYAASVNEFVAMRGHNPSSAVDGNPAITVTFIVGRSIFATAVLRPSATKRVSPSPPIPAGVASTSAPGTVKLNVLTLTVASDRRRTDDRPLFSSLMSRVTRGRPARTIADRAFGTGTMLAQTENRPGVEIHASRVCN